MITRPEVMIYADARLGEVIAKLPSEGFEVFQLPGGMADLAAFFDGARAVLPLDPPIVSNRSLDAVEDSLWEGLYHRHADRFAIVWPNASLMVRTSERAFNDVLATLFAAADALSRPEPTLGKTKLVMIVLGI